MKREIKKRVKSEGDMTTAQILKNLDKYIADLAESSSQVDLVFNQILDQIGSLTPSQHSELIRQVKAVIKNDADYMKRLKLYGERAKILDEAFGDK